MNQIRGILDTSTLIAYTDLDTSLAVGEFIQQIDEEQDHVGIPVSAFVAAYAQLSRNERGRSTLLSLAADAAFARQREDQRQSVFIMLPLLEADAVEVSEYETRWPGRGQVIREAEKHGVYSDDEPHGAIIASYDPPQDWNALPPSVVYLDLSADWDDLGNIDAPE